MNTEQVNIFDIEAMNKKLAVEEKRKRQKEISDVKRILKTPEGRRYVWRLMSECGVFRSSFQLNSNQTAFNEGKRDMGLGILSEVIEADSTAYAKMQNEHVSALQSKKEAQSA